MERGIGSVRRYVGTAHDGLCGVRVEIIAIHRGPTPDEREIPVDDGVIGRVEASDVVEFAPLVRENGTDRTSLVSSDANGWEFEPPLCQRRNAPT
ncbi:MAG: hypothetical protein HYR85_23990 [Planctomycetes bacterium]|nr:hypothetical protein [Planctomycetota bacterium]